MRNKTKSFLKYEHAEILNLTYLKNNQALYILINVEYRVWNRLSWLLLYIIQQNYR